MENFESWLKNVYIKDDGTRMTEASVKSYMSRLNRVSKEVFNNTSDVIKMDIPNIILTMSKIEPWDIKNYGWIKTVHQDIVSAINVLLCFKKGAESIYKTRTPYKWTDELILEEAFKHNSLSMFAKTNQVVYKLARKKQDLLAKINMHMFNKKYSWTEESIFYDAKKYKSFNEWKTLSPMAVKSAQRDCNKKLLLKCLIFFSSLKIKRDLFNTHPHLTVDECIILLKAFKIEKTKMFNKATTSYGLKHRVERYATMVTNNKNYCSNGVLIEAMVKMGFDKQLTSANSPNYYFNISEKSLKDLTKLSDANIMMEMMTEGRNVFIPF